MHYCKFSNDHKGYFPPKSKVTAIKHLTYHLNIRVIAFLSTDKLAVALFFIVGGNCYELHTRFNWFYD